MINGQPIGRFIIASGYNANGWYEIYNDGFKRVGHRWPADKPLYSPVPTGCIKIPFPIAFTRIIMSVNTSIETTTHDVEFINYEIYSLDKLGLTAGTISYRGLEALANFACSYVAEGY
ncbi:hypothetical protein [uncultured Gilliamella sp.]|uniref:hypothetical protein n=1 Tax=uncultured Gilliamella sp. TaxID=1193505 RepID=UPI0025F38431|nr:hypothetical protein [uncultured Gilliamella sp.]